MKSKDFKIDTISCFGTSNQKDNSELISNGLSIYNQLNMCKEILDSMRIYISSYNNMTNDDFKSYYIKELITFNNDVATLSCSIADTFILMDSLNKKEKLDLCICLNSLKLIRRLNLEDSVYPQIPYSYKLFETLGEELLILIDKVVTFIISLYKGRCFMNNDNYELCLDLKLYIRTLNDKIIKI